MEKGTKIKICFASVVGKFDTETTSEDKIKSYKNLFSQIYSGSKFPISLHLTGDFIQELQKKNQPFSVIINELLSKKQIELIGGGYFSPLFPMLPTSDIVGQIEMLTNSFRKYFAERPKGAFLPFSAWKPSLIGPMRKAGMEYCLIDHRCFTRSDLHKYDPVCIEESGKIITAVPYMAINNTQSTTPEDLWKSIQKEMTGSSSKIIVVFLPVEAFSGKPEEKKWFSRILQIIGQESDVTLSTIWETIKAIKLYKKGFIEANIVQNDEPKNVSINKLLIENEYAYTMYSKIMHVHTLANQIRGDKPTKKTALEELWRAESANFFMEGGFIPHNNKRLRNQCYRHLLLAEKVSRRPEKFSNSLIPFDFNLDGVEEYLSQREKINMYVHLNGGHIFECDFLPAHKNYADIPYKDTGMFIDYVVNESEIEALKNGNIPKSIFANTQYQVAKCNRAKYTLQLKTYNSYKKQNLNLKKQYVFLNEGVQVQYILKNDSQETLSAYFISEIDIAVGESEKKIPELSIYSENKKSKIKVSSDSFSNVAWLQLDDSEGKSKFVIEANEVPNLILLPIHYENTQKPIGIRAYFFWKINLPPAYETEKMLFLTIDKIYKR